MVDVSNELPRPNTFRVSSSGFSNYAARSDHQHGIDLEMANYLGNLPNRNYVDNAAMLVAQRPMPITGIVGVTSNLMDRWRLVSPPATATSTVNRIADAPANTPLDFCQEVLVTTAKAGLAVGDEINLGQTIDSITTSKSLQGKTGATPLILSFWVKSNAPGIYTAELFHVPTSTFCSRPYRIEASGVWEKKVVTFVPKTTGATLPSFSTEFVLQFILAAGTNFTSGTTSIDYQATSANRAVGQTNLYATVNNYLRITGVQLEASSAVTPFELEDYDDTLIKCYRSLRAYGGIHPYQPFSPVGFFISNSLFYAPLLLPSRMRTTPTLSTVGAIQMLDSANTSPAMTAVSVADGDRLGFLIRADSAATFTLGRSGFIRANNDLNARLYLSAEA
ncbi:tail fiber protein [Caudoviricetes sp.]|nr:tail fiber protein [Caudoviricetes sp.]